MNMSFLNIMLCYYFSLEAVLQGMAKNNPTEKHWCKNAGDIEGWASVKTQSLSLQIAQTDSNHKLQLLASEYQQQSPGGVLWKACF